MSWTSNAGIRFKLGHVALWNRLTKRVIDASDPTLALLAQYNPEEFGDMTTRELPTSLAESRKRSGQ